MIKEAVSESLAPPPDFYEMDGYIKSFRVNYTFNTIPALNPADTEAFLVNGIERAGPIETPNFLPMYIEGVKIMPHPKVVSLFPE